MYLVDNFVFNPSKRYIFFFTNIYICVDRLVDYNLDYGDDFILFFFNIITYVLKKIG